jgi:hypothetical protein
MDAGPGAPAHLRDNGRTLAALTEDPALAAGVLLCDNQEGVLGGQQPEQQPQQQPQQPQPQQQPQQPQQQQP